MGLIVLAFMFFCLSVIITLISCLKEKDLSLLAAFFFAFGMLFTFLGIGNIKTTTINEYLNGDIEVVLEKTDIIGNDTIKTYSFKYKED